MASFDGLTARVEQRARDIAERMMRLAEAALADFPDIMLRREDNHIPDKDW